jgi:regulator of RNase E activity RraB
MNVIYTTRNDENEPVTIEANLDFEPMSDDTVWMLWAFAPLKTSDGAGGCAEEERRTLDAINATLGEVLELRNGGLYAGMRLQEGWAELYYYAAWSKGAEKQFRDVFKQHGYAQIEFGANRDAQQAFYYETLCPDAYELQQVKNREIIGELSRAGDDLSAPRPVEHYLFFQTSSAMQRAATQLVEQQGRIETGLHEEGRYPHGLMLERVHDCRPETLEAETAPLIALADKEYGIYRGWSTVLAGETPDNA